MSLWDSIGSALSSAMGSEDFKKSFSYSFATGMLVGGFLGSRSTAQPKSLSSTQGPLLSFDKDSKLDLKAREYINHFEDLHRSKECPAYSIESKVNVDRSKEKTMMKWGLLQGGAELTTSQKWTVDRCKLYQQIYRVNYFKNGDQRYVKVLPNDMSIANCGDFIKLKYQKKI